MNINDTCFGCLHVCCLFSVAGNTAPDVVISDILITNTKTKTRMIDFSFTETKTNTNKILKSETI